jgi:hypothetical protein
MNDFKIKAYIRPLESERENLMFITRLEEAGISDWGMTRYKDVEFISIPISHYLFRSDIKVSTLLSPYFTENNQHLRVLKLSDLADWSLGRSGYVGLCYLANGVTGEIELVNLSDFISRADNGSRLGIIPSVFFNSSKIK